jgi:hypothetical protein
MHLRARRSAQPFGGSRMLLSPRAAIIASAGALLAWLSVLFGTIQVAYMLDAYSVLDQDIAIALGAFAGLTATTWFLFTRSRLGRKARVVVAAASLVAFAFLALWGGLFIACANGNCL